MGKEKVLLGSLRGANLLMGKEKVLLGSFLSKKKIPKRSSFWEFRFGRNFTPKRKLN